MPDWCEPIGLFINFLGNTMIIAGTGHRPNKLGGYSLNARTRLFNTAIKSLEYLAPTKVISGMALGWDQALARAAIELGIPFIAAVPFVGQENIWPAASQREFHELCKAASEHVIVSPGGYSPAKMQVRNEWMVDRADRILALWDGSSGGTKNCLDYAATTGKPVSNAWKCFQNMR